MTGKYSVGMPDAGRLILVHLSKPQLFYTHRSPPPNEVFYQHYVVANRFPVSLVFPFFASVAASVSIFSLGNWAWPDRRRDAGVRRSEWYRFGWLGEC